MEIAVHVVEVYGIGERGGGRGGGGRGGREEGVLMQTAAGGRLVVIGLYILVDRLIHQTVVDDFV